MKNRQENLGEVVLYKTEDGKAALDVRLAGETVWLTQAQMAKLFERDQSVISRHVSNVFKEKGLGQKSNMQKMHVTKSDKPVVFCSLDMFAPPNGCNEFCCTPGANLGQPRAGPEKQHRDVLITELRTQGRNPGMDSTSPTQVRRAGSSAPRWE